ncbi:ABC transporter ATP-binding protein [Roseibium aggregatum]|jgi:spermidine/putrescine transport system ATP-binding protein|uniref:ABC transporter ATP-binding protein n=1 Tax=Roseibium aggregatum TaxID=187304 RepID=UPI001E35198F|nr:ABC transporter ATP-binding protein [Roseibium aggregatum]UES48462.1 polyamine ABC transporter ATP-binding protein [Roseibium aggregatum]
MQGILRIESASKSFQAPEGGVIRALDNVSLTVAHNEFLTLLGPSGCGKTTLLRAVSGFEDLDGGEIYIDGQPVSDQPAHKRPVNTVFQRYALFPHLSVQRNVAYSLEVRGVAKAEIRQRVGSMLELVGLAGMGARKIGQLSGGQQQRVALARSLVARPKILLLDEPLSALDKNLRHKMQQELKTLQHELGISFIFVTHDQEEALVMSDRIAVLNGGNIQQLDAPEELYRRPANEFVARFIGESNLLDATVVSVAGTRCDVVLTDGTVIRDCPVNGLKRGDPAKVLIRPENLLADLGQSGSGERAGHEISGTVSESFFAGTDYRLVLSCQGLPPVRASLRAGPGTSHHTIGEQTSLFVPHDAVHLIPGNGVPA